ncbi:MAG: lipoprotein-releasing ABC transporter permease subunit [Pseudomonadales bacterium]|nr:lipoprotein-releasing ABC transporter permease subunit [Pseudomonadales bacterium]
MSASGKYPALFIGTRYASLRSSNLLVGFISWLSMLGLAAGVAILITVLSVVNGFDRELQQRILALIPHMTLSTARNNPLASEAQWQPLRESIEAVPGVSGTAPWLQLQGLLLARGQAKGVLLQGIDPVQEQQVSILGDFLTEGSLDSLTSGSYHIALGAALARQLGVQVGDTVTLVSTVVPLTPMGEFTRQKRFTVGAIFSIGSQLDGNLAYVHLQDAQRLYRLGEGIHGLRVQTDDLFAVFTLGQSLRELLPSSVVVNNWTASYGAIYENIRISKTMVGLLLTLLVAVAAFNVVVSLIMVVRDKRGDIAILRTMGCSLGTIRRIFLVQGAMIGLIGTGLGLVLGLVLTTLAGPLVNWIQTHTSVVLLNPDVYPVNYLPTEILPGDLLLICALALLLSLLATLYPASRAARLKPAEILRYE